MTRATAHGGSRTLAVATAAMAVLLVALAILQYRWVGQVSDAERERLRRALEIAADAIADDFDREVFRAFLAFAPMRHSSEPLDERLADGWDRWQASALEPGLVRSVFVVARADGPRDATALLELDPVTRELAPAQWPAELAALDRVLGLALRGRPRSGPGERARGPRSPFAAAAPALVLPVWRPRGRDADGDGATQLRGRDTEGALSAQAPPLDDAASGDLVLVLLDRDLIARTLLPSLVDLHLGAEPRETEVWVVDRTRRGEPVFATLAPPPAPRLERGDGVTVRPLLGLRSFPELRSQGFARSFDDADDLPGRFDRERGANRRDAGARASRGPDGDGPQQRPPSWGRPASPRTAEMGPGDQGPWALVVARSEGSLEAAVARLRRSNLGIGLAMVALLGVTGALLLLSARQAQRLARREMELVAGITHELRTPLASISSAAENLADGVVSGPEQVRRYGSLIRGETHRLGALVSQVLDFAGTAATRRRARPVEAVEIGPILDRVLADHGWAIEEAGVAVERREAPHLPLVYADPESLRRALDNVVGNALKYGAAGRWLGIETRALDGDTATDSRTPNARSRRGAHGGGARRGGPRVAVRVSDRGPGIARVDRRRIFEPFYRGADATSAHLHGTGLGLAVTRTVLESFDGTIDVEESAPGGTTFLITLPAAFLVATAAPVDASPQRVAT